MFSIVTAPFYIQGTMHKGSGFSTSSPTFIIFWGFFYGHPNKCEVITREGDDLYFPDDY